MGTDSLSDGGPGLSVVRLASFTIDGNDRQDSRNVMQYLLLIHDNVKTATTVAEWTAFIARAQESGMFRGGSELGTRELIGRGAPVPSSAHIGGFMRFETDDKPKLLELLLIHPFVAHGGTVELCEMPKS